MNENIVFVIGAGASKEVDLPTGVELKQNITSLLNFNITDYDDGWKLTRGDGVIYDLRNSNGDSGNFTKAASQIVKALPDQAKSIDNFINNHRDNEKIALCGKLAIIRAILQAEKNSKLFFEKSNYYDNFDFSKLKETWYNPFFQLLHEDCDVKEIRKRLKSITLIIFNYDRCVEQFLYLALQNFYGIQEKEAAEIIQEVSIYHPYGQVGELPWLKQENGVEFGEELWNSTELLNLSKQIKTFTEGTDPNSSEILEIRKKMKVANKIVFLGFAFQKLNMQLIKPDNSSVISTLGNSTVKCFATTKGISNSDSKVVEEQIKNLFHKEVVVNLKDLTCAEFFNEYWRSLSF